ncbi:MAG: radical SAM protein [Anaerolineae bacterium]
MHHTLIMKVASACNLACAYCYDRIRQKRSHSYVMSNTVLERSIREYLAISDPKPLFIWHGGEPLLAGKEFFEKVIDLQKQYKHDGQDIANGIQTNGFLLDEEWVSFLAQNKFDVGISLDGPQSIHDRNRLTNDGVGSYQQVMRGVEELKRANVNFGVLSVVTRDSVDHPDEIYDFFKQHAIKSFDLLALMDKTSDRAITLKEFGDFMIRMFDRWMEDNDPSVHIRYFDNQLRGILRGKPSLCYFAGKCTNFMSVDTDGDVYPCDNLASFQELKLGNILLTSLPKILSSVPYEEFVSAVNAPNPECQNCEFLAACHSGCTYDRYVRRGKISDKSSYCGAQKRIFSHIQAHVRQLIESPTEGVTGSESPSIQN